MPPPPPPSAFQRYETARQDTQKARKEALAEALQDLENAQRRILTLDIYAGRKLIRDSVGHMNGSVWARACEACTGTGMAPVVGDEPFFYSNPPGNNVALRVEAGFGVPSRGLFGISSTNTGPSTLQNNDSPSTTSMFGSGGTKTGLFGSSSATSMFGSGGTKTSLFGTSPTNTGASTLQNNDSPSTTSMFGSGGTKTGHFGSSSATSLFGNNAAKSSIFRPSSSDTETSATPLNPHAPSLKTSNARTSIFTSIPASTGVGTSPNRSQGLFDHSNESTIFGALKKDTPLPTPPSQTFVFQSPLFKAEPPTGPGFLLGASSGNSMQAEPQINYASPSKAGISTQLLATTESLKKRKAENEAKSENTDRSFNSDAGDGLSQKGQAKIEGV
ncbi:hypothetical protein B7494_g8555 [Chlorociboria aeruginascens]|nr:hypothetical protein B7494_g8555 [Chlorociboria aeruginascens]